MTFIVVLYAWVGFLIITVAAFAIARHVEQTAVVQRRRHARLYDQDRER